MPGQSLICTPASLCGVGPPAPDDDDDEIPIVASLPLQDPLMQMPPLSSLPLPLEPPDPPLLLFGSPNPLPPPFPPQLAALTADTARRENP
jgi:hypothetical protein